MWNPFSKKHDGISRTNPGFEETERRTTKAGILMLILMFVAGVFFGNKALGDLAKIPDKPAPLSSCSYQFRSAGSGIISNKSNRSPFYYEVYQQYDDYSSSRGCNFSEIEKKYNIPSILNKWRPVLAEYDRLSNEERKVEHDLAKVNMDLDRRSQEYSMGLQELQAEVSDPAFPANDVQRQALKQLFSRRASLISEQKEIQNKIADMGADLQMMDEDIRVAYQPVFEEHNRALRWHDFKVFLLEFLFILPFFWLAYYLYIRLLRKDSPYAVIFLVILGVAGILFLRVIFGWFYGLFLQDILEALFRWFKEFKILRSLVFYGGMLLSFAVFGSAVYFLQKKVFDPRRVMLRRFRAHQCPNCQTDLNLAELYCPNCGEQLREKCGQCGENRFKGLPTCPHCGVKKQESAVL